jgi:hypothetical protein
MTNQEDADLQYVYPRKVFDLENDNQGCFNFGGVNEYVTLGDVLDPGTSAFSVSFWAKGYTANRTLIGKDVFTTGTDNGLLMYYAANKASYWNGTATYSFGTVTDLVWHHFVVTRGSTSANDAQLYFDGVPVVTFTESRNMANTKSLVFGADSVFSSPLIGKMSHVSFFDTKLNDSHVSELYNDGSPTDLLQHTASANLTGWWKLDATDDPTGTVNDIIGSNDGTATNMEAGDLVTTDYPTN